MDIKSLGSGNKSYFVLVLLLFLLGTFLRVYDLAHESYWYDEAYAANISEASFQDLFSGKEKDNGNPPLFYIALKAWKSVGLSSDTVMRLLPALFGVFSLFAFYFFSKPFLSDKEQLLALALLTISPLHIFLSQELRMYSLLFLETVLIYWMIWKYLESDKKKFLFIYIVVGILSLYTHYFSGLVLFSLNIYLILHLLRERRLKSLALIQLCNVIILLGFFPWMSSFIEQTFGRGDQVGDGYASRLHIAAFPLTSLFARTLVWKQSNSLVLGGALLLSTSLIIFSIIGIWKSKFVGKWFLLSGLLIGASVIILVVFVLDIHVFDARKGLIFLVPGFILIAKGLSGLNTRLAIPAVSLLVGLMLVSDIKQKVFAHKNDWRSIVSDISDKYSSQDVIATYPDFLIISFNHYKEKYTLKNTTYSLLDLKKGSEEINVNVPGDKEIINLLDVVPVNGKLILIMDKNYTISDKSFDRMLELLSIEYEVETSFEYKRKMILHEFKKK